MRLYKARREPTSLSQAPGDINRVIGTVYQNTGSKPIYITLNLNLGATGDLYFYTGTDNPPTTLITRCYTGIVFARWNGSFIVLPGHYYRLVENGVGGAISTWNEWS